MEIDEETNELNGKIQFVCELMLAMEKGERLGIGGSWEVEAKKLAKSVLELIDKLGLPKWGSKDESHLWN